MIQLRNAFIFLAISMALLLTACVRDTLNAQLRSHELIPFTAEYIEGDDGLTTYLLSITQQDSSFSAIEVSTTNYISSKTFDTLKLAKLNPLQVRAVRQFLVAARNLPAHCDQRSSVTQQLTIQLPFKQVRVAGNCDWGAADYFGLRTILFGK